MSYTYHSCFMPLRPNDLRVRPAEWPVGHTFVYTALARQAITHAVRQLTKIGQRVLVPSFTCRTVADAVEHAGRVPVFYSQHPNRLQPMLGRQREHDIRAMIYADFVYHDSSAFKFAVHEIRRVYGSHIPIIYDASHRFPSFNPPGNVAATVYSFRKHLPCATGAAVVFKEAPRLKRVKYTDLRAGQQSAIDYVHIHRLSGAMKQKPTEDDGPVLAQYERAMEPYAGNLQPIDRISQGILSTWLCRPPDFQDEALHRRVMYTLFEQAWPRERESAGLFCSIGSEAEPPLGFPVLLSRRYPAQRFVDKMHRFAGVSCLLAWPLSHIHPGAQKMLIVQQLAERVALLPLHPWYDKDDVRRIVKFAKRFSK